MQTEEQRRYRSNAADIVHENQKLAKEQASDMKKTAKKIPADRSEQKVTRSTEGSVERTTERTGDRG